MVIIGKRLASNSPAIVRLKMRSLFRVLRVVFIIRPKRVHVQVDPTVTKEKTINSINTSLATAVALLVYAVTELMITETPFGFTNWNIAACQNRNGWLDE